MTRNAYRIVVLGLGNAFRRDDAVGTVAAAAVADLALPNVDVITGISEPFALVEAWAGADLAVIIDAAAGNDAVPGRIRRCTLSDVAAGSGGLSSHSIDLARAHALGRALGRVPRELVVLTIEVSDTGYGTGMTARVAAAGAEVVGMALAEINRIPRPVTRSPRPASP